MTDTSAAAATSPKPVAKKPETARERLARWLGASSRRAAYSVWHGLSQTSSLALTAYVYWFFFVRGHYQPPFESVVWYDHVFMMVMLFYIGVQGLTGLRQGVGSVLTLMTDFGLSAVPGIVVGFAFFAHSNDMTQYESFRAQEIIATILIDFFIINGMLMRINRRTISMGTEEGN